MIDPFTLLGIAGQAGQIATSFLQSKNFLINTEMRAEQLRAISLTHDQQLKMFHLQQDYKVRDFSIDQMNKFDQETYKSLLKIHEQRSIECKVPPYALGQWLKSTILPNEASPYIIICTNTYQGDSPFKNEDVIKPLHKVYHNLKEYNSLCSDLITVTETRQYFNTDEDVRNFYIRELQCPVILVYSNFIGSSLVIDMLYAGITNQQNILNLNLNRPSFVPKTIRLWEMDYTLIHNIKSKKKDTNSDNNGISENPYQWKKNLDNLIEAFVGIKVQSLIDEYFQNSYTYKPQAIKYLNDRKEKYSGMTEWKDFESEILTRHNIILHRQKEFDKSFNQKFLNTDKISIKIAVLGKIASGKSALINSIVQEEIVNDSFDNIYSNKTYIKPPYEIIEVSSNNFKFDKGEMARISETTDLEILVVDSEPLKPEIELFDFLHSCNPNKPRIVFFNKADKLDYLLKKDITIIKERTTIKMSKYIKTNDDIIFGFAQIYDKQSDMMILQDNFNLRERIYKEIQILNK